MRDQDRRQIMRLLHGELGEAEAAALRARLAEEPELRAGLDRLERVWQNLEAGPQEEPGARSLRADVVRRLSPAGVPVEPMVSFGWSAAPVWARAAAALALVAGMALGAGLALRAQGRAAPEIATEVSTPSLAGEGLAEGYAEALESGTTAQPSGGGEVQP